MKILLLYTYNKSFLSEFFTEFSELLVNDGHEVNVFSLKSSSYARVYNGVNIWVYKRGGYLANYYNVFKILYTIRPDVMISNFSYVNPSLVFGSILGVKHKVVWFHSLKKQINPSYLNVLLKGYFLKLADLIISNSPKLKDELQTHYKVPLAKQVSLPFWSTVSRYSFNGVSQFKAGSGLKIGCPGRLDAVKNQQVVIDALFQLFQEYNFDFQLYFAGEGPSRSLLEKHVDDCGLGSCVSFLGVLSSEQMIDFYTSMDLIILPSLDEAFGLVFLEAIALGVPVIVSNTFGALEYVLEDECFGKEFTFDPENAVELKLKILTYFKGTGLSSSFFKDIYHRFYSKNTIYQQLRHVLNL